MRRAFVKIKANEENKIEHQQPQRMTKMKIKTQTNEFDSDDDV